MKRQQGYFSLTAIIMMAMMLLSTLFVIRSTSVATVISGNISFKHAAIQYGDIAMKSATTQVNALTNFENTIAGQYYATQLAQNSYGLPNINWASVPINQLTGSPYQYQQITERLCSGTLPIANTVTQCMTYSQQGLGGSNNVGSMIYIPSPSIYYRVTVKVTGPRNTTTYVQGILLK